MMPAVLSEGLIDSWQLHLLATVRKLIEVLPDELTCHEVCERISNLLYGQVIHIKGKFNYWDHSWLEIPNSTIIIDAYPWACASGPILVDTQTGSPWATLYKANIDQERCKESWPKEIE